MKVISNSMRGVLANRLPRSRFARNVAILMTGTAFGQALSIIVMPILTRLYGPSDYGIYVLYNSLVVVLAVIACWRYELAIVLPEKDEDAANLLVLSLLICFGMATVSLLMAAFFRESLARLLGAPQLAPWLWCIPLSIMATGFFQVFNFWCSRKRHFKRLAMRQIVMSSVTAATQITNGAGFHAGCWGLISGAILGQSVATGTLFRRIWKEEGKQIYSAIRRVKIRLQLSRYRKFPLYSSWSGLLNSGSISLPPLLLGHFFSSAVVGQYSLGFSLLAMPMSLIGTSTSRVFFPQATEAKREGNLNTLSNDVYFKLLFLAFTPIVLVVLVAPELFGWIFGAKWVQAGSYAKWLSIWLVFQFASSPISSCFDVLNRQNLELIFNIFLFSVRLSALAIGGFLNSPLLAIQLLGIVGAILYLGYGIIILHITGNRLSKTLLMLSKTIFKSLPFLVVPLFIKILNISTLLTFTSCIIFSILFLLYLSRKRDPIIIETKNV